MKIFQTGILCVNYELKMFYDGNFFSAILLYLHCTIFAANGKPKEYIYRNDTVNTL